MLRAAIGPLRAALSRASAIGELIRMEADGQTLTCTAPGDDCRIMEQVPCDGSMSPIVIVGGPISQALQSRADDLLVEIGVNGTSISFKHGEYRAKIPIVKSTVDPLSADPTNSVSADGLSEALGRAASTAELAVLIEYSPDRVIVFSASAGMRRAYLSECSISCPADGRVCISRSSASFVSRMVADSWWIADRRVYFRDEKTTFRASSVRDPYPTDILGAMGADKPMYICEFETATLSLAIKSATTVLRDDVDVALKIVGHVPDRGPMFEISARNTISDQAASERILARGAQMHEWTGRVNAADLRAALGLVKTDRVMVGLCKNRIEIEEAGAFRSYISLLSGVS